MTASTASPGPDRPILPASRQELPRLMPGLVIATVLGMIIGPRATPFYLGALALAALVLLYRERQPLIDVSPLRGLPATLGVFGIYAMLSALWSVVPGEAAKLGFFFLLCVAFGVVLVRFIMREEGERLSRLGLGLLVGMVIGVLYLGFEFATGHLIKRFLFNTFDLIRPESQKYFRVRKGDIRLIATPYFNRNVATMTMMLWPALLIAAQWPARTTRRVLIATLLGVGSIVVAFSDHESSKLALALSFVAFGIFKLMPRHAWKLLAAGWIGLVLGIVPLAHGLFVAKVYEAEWIQSTGRARLILWGYTASQVGEHPLLGVGVASTKALDRQNRDTAGKLEGQPYDLRTGRHAHNIYLQTWYELGLLGALGLLAIGIMAIGRLSGVTPRARPYAYAALVTAIVMAALSWGIWQPWFAPAFALMAAGLAIGIRFAEKDGAAMFRNDGDGAGE
ncbi:MAG: O-antigen ligase family protein [Hyphomicrobiaceae bacterium]